MYSLCSYSIESRFARFVGQFLVNSVCEIKKQKQLWIRFAHVFLLAYARS